MKSIMAIGLIALVAVCISWTIGLIDGLTAAGSIIVIFIMLRVCCRPGAFPEEKPSKIPKHLQGTFMTIMSGTALGLLGLVALDCSFSEEDSAGSLLLALVGFLVLVAGLISLVVKSVKQKQ